MKPAERLWNELQELNEETIIFVNGRAFVVRPVNEDDLKRLKEQKNEEE